MARMAITGQQVRDLMSVKDAMMPTPIEVAPETPLPEAARRMIEYGIHHLAVTENRHRFLGVLSSMDILRAVAEG